MQVRDIEVVSDRTEQSRCDEGFLRVRRLLVRNLYADGSHSEPYPCDVVSRVSIDAVAVVLYQVVGTEESGRRIRVVLKDGVRPATYLRKQKDLVAPDRTSYLTVTEIAAGVLEPGDAGPGGVDRRAAAEALEECGVDVAVESVRRLGGEMFPSPGVGDEKVFFRSAPVDIARVSTPAGDGSVMEEATAPVILDFDEALARCRRGEIPDMKTELALLRLADQLGYLPQLGLFLHELPDDLQGRYRRPGLENRG